MRRCFFCIWMLFLSMGVLASATVRAEKAAPGSGERLLVLAPHPDDETIGAAGLILQAKRQGADVRVVYLTHGDYNEIASIFYQKKPLVFKSDFIQSGKTRKEEAVRAMKVLGLGEKDLTFLGYPDLGTLAIWRRHWGDARSFTSFPTGLNHVPYEHDFSYGRPFKGESVVHDLERILLLFQPTRVAVTGPYDLNPDHKAAWLYLKVALMNLEGRIQAPEVLSYPVHAVRWPAPKKFVPEEPLLPPFGPEGGDLEWRVVELEPEHRSVKKEALLAYQSQIAYSRAFLLSFIRRNELFALIPEESLFGAAEKSGRQAVSYRLQDSDLEVTLRTEEDRIPLDLLSAELFGYRTGTPFAEMPKMDVRYFGGQVSVRINGRRTDGSGIRAEPLKKGVRLRVPLTELGEPQAVFACAHASRERASEVWGSWRLLKIDSRS